MKNLLLLLVAVAIGFLGFAQEYIPLSKELQKLSVQSTHQLQNEIATPAVNSNSTSPKQAKAARLLGEETELMETLYDLQSNAALSNRLWLWEDGTMAAVCTRGIEDPAGFVFPDRGTGYNYFDGAEWGDMPTERIEDVRTGWPSIAGWGENGEVVVSHDFGNHVIAVLTRPDKGSGNWTKNVLEGPEGSSGIVWARMVTSGDNHEYIHVIALTTPTGNGGSVYQGQDGALLYSRSMDGGVSWEPKNELLEGIGADSYWRISADDYTFAARGNTIAFVCVSTLYDMFMFKSEDNGTSWNKTVIWEHPFPLFDYTINALDDTLYCPGNSAEVAIDAYGKCHVVYNISRILMAEPSSNGSYTYFPYIDGIGYWNENMEAPIPTPEEVPAWANYPEYWTLNPEYLYEDGLLIGYVQDVNGDGEITFVEVASGEFPFANYRELGTSCMPTLTITDDDKIAVAFSSVTETFATSDDRYNYRHIWVTTSPDLGATWGENNMVDLQAGELFHIFDECIYPQFAANNPSTAANFELIYMADEKPGVFLDEDEQLEATTNRIIHNSVPKTIVGIEESAANSRSTFDVSECYPNPTNGTTTIALSLENAARVSVEIFNLTGQKVMDVAAVYLAKGTHSISFNVTNLTAGAYFYTVNAGSQSITKKMIVE